MKLFDTAQKLYTPFKPGHTVKMYVCGVTPYDSAHLGHIFTFMTYDLLQRRLEDAGYEVLIVRNITDVDEPLYVKARKLGIAYTELAEREIADLHKVMEALNFRPLHAEPRASEYIAEMAAAVGKLEAAGFAYRLDNGDVYYDTAADPDFGSFSGFSDRLLLGLMANRGGDPKRPDKRQPLDFLLWKVVPDPADSARWDSSLGPGRPGWHIECSVMSRALLGETFDLHGGGNDLIFPHHECEIAQSYGLGVPKPVKHWVHVAPLLYEGEKMSKSLGNLVFAKDLLADYEPAVIRLALMHYHHRIGGEWQPELLESAQKLWHQLQAKAETASQASAETLLGEVRAALDDDLNTPDVIDTLRQFVRTSRATAERTHAQALIQKALTLLGLL